MHSVIENVIGFVLGLSITLLPSVLALKFIWWLEDRRVAKRWQHELASWEKTGKWTGEGNYRKGLRH